MDEAILEDPLGLTRVTVRSARLRVDLALPGNVVVAELLPHVLRFVNVAAADGTTGWVLRRAAGQAVDPARSLDVQGVRDGEVLTLVPRTMEWPEPAPDDPLEIITEASGRAGPRWTRRARGLAFLVTGGLLLAWGLVAITTAGPPWTAAGGCAVGGAVLLVLVATTISRSFRTDLAATALGVLAPLYAFAGGVLLLVPNGAGLSGAGASGVLVGSAGMLTFGVLVALGIGTAPWLLTAAVTGGLAGLIGAGLSLAGTTAGGAAAVVVVLAAGLLPAFPLLALRFGRIPVPPVAVTATEILAERPKPPRPLVYSAVARSTSLLTGMVLGASTAGGVAVVLLVRDGGVSGVILAGCAGAVFALRTRAFPLIAQRVPLLTVAVVSAILLGRYWLDHAAGLSPLVIASATALLGLVLVLAGAVYGRRDPGPFLGRAAEIVDAAAALAFVPLACGTLGLFGLIWTLAG
ncbi:type VII secretion integral membrane protein EccD [Micromonospora echinaurantiaca]|uniref:type VII secretion integral membrane protein EccD n=1 Tax=Micromonospora echinaurantiaca TaxID=47857 RepID=UPI0037B9F8F2